MSPTCRILMGFLGGCEGGGEGEGGGRKKAPGVAWGACGRRVVSWRVLAEEGGVGDDHGDGVERESLEDEGEGLAFAGEASDVAGEEVDEDGGLDGGEAGFVVEGEVGVGDGLEVVLDADGEVVGAEELSVVSGEELFPDGGVLEVGEVGGEGE